MKTVLVFSVLMILVQNIENNVQNEDNIQKVLLRKLQNIQRNETEAVSWNEILADVLVEKITKSKVNKEVANKSSYLSKCFSKALWIFKTHFYDRPSKNFDIALETNNTNVTLAPETNEGEVITQTNTDSIDTTQTKFDKHDPKSEVEFIVPAYHGKLEESTELSPAIEPPSIEPTPTIEESRIKRSECPEGFQKNQEGNCIDPKTSKFIMYIPSQCPIGYQRDRRGYCRLLF